MMIVDAERSDSRTTRDRINGWGVQRSHQWTACQRQHQRQRARDRSGSLVSLCLSIVKWGGFHPRSRLVARATPVHRRMRRFQGWFF